MCCRRELKATGPLGLEVLTLAIGVDTVGRQASFNGIEATEKSNCLHAAVSIAVLNPRLKVPIADMIAMSGHIEGPENGSSALGSERTRQRSRW